MYGTRNAWNMEHGTFVDPKKEAVTPAQKGRVTDRDRSDVTVTSPSAAPWVLVF